MIYGENIGARGSYLDLLAEARRSEPDLIALADQDDVWLPGELQRAVDALGTVEESALYCSWLIL